MHPPLEIYLLRHPADKGGADRAAKAVQRHFMRQNAGTDAMASGRYLGLAISVRTFSVADPDTIASLPVGGEPRRSRAVVVAFVDGNMRDDQAWIRWLGKLATEPEVTLILAYRGQIEPLGFHDGVHALKLGATIGDDDMDRLRVRLMIICTKYLRTDEGGPKLFVSYHEQGGLDVANALLRDKIGSNYAPIELFVASDRMIEGDQYREIILGEIHSANAVIAVFSREYPDRTWCASEVGWARTPRRVLEHDGCWQVTPLVIVDHIEASGPPGQRWSWVLPDFGGCPLIRWHGDLALDVLERALTEGVVGAFHRTWSQQVSGSQEADVCINWVPDTATLAHLRLEGALPTKSRVGYPGYGLHTRERDRLMKLFDIELRTFEELR